MSDHLDKLTRLMACMELAKQFHETGDLAHEAQQLQEAVRLSPELWAARKQLALVHLEKDDVFQMAQTLVAWQKEDPGTYPDDFASKHSAFASKLTIDGLDLKIRAGDDRRAMEYYRLALQLAPDDPEALYNLGDSLDDSGEPEEAEKVFERLVHVHPDYADAWNTLGVIREKKLKRPYGENGAEKCYERALSLDPHLERAQTNLRRLKSSFWSTILDGIDDDD